MVWLKIREHDIIGVVFPSPAFVVVWLKIREHDIKQILMKPTVLVVVWLKIREHDISAANFVRAALLWFD